ncbi:MAG: segregation/condensation protein A [Candidatus Magasanikbacteria bacterium]|nr:segregation/condensation protein A [Candidatus Magasanikbacteria bacterium]
MTKGIYVQFNAFDGPLDLLLSLLDEKKMEISEVSISSVTESYLEYLDTLEVINPQELADFLVIATKLLFLKSKTLLPEFTHDEDEGMRLEDQLKLYRQFVEASKQVNILWLDDRSKGYGRIEAPLVSEKFVAPPRLDTDMLHISMLQLISRLEPPHALPQTHIDTSISMKERIDAIRTLLKKSNTFSFHKILSKAASKTEIIVSFLALLELVKQRDIYVEQDEAFGDMKVVSL